MRIFRGLKQPRFFTHFRHFSPHCKIFTLCLAGRWFRADIGFLFNNNISRSTRVLYTFSSLLILSFIQWHFPPKGSKLRPGSMKIVHPVFRRLADSSPLTFSCVAGQPVFLRAKVLKDLFNFPASCCNGVIIIISNHPLRLKKEK